MAKRPLRIPNRSEIADDTPLQLAAAAQLAFPDGTMSALGLRNAATRGELEHERLGGRVYTTLGWIREWRTRNRYPARSRAAPGQPAVTDASDSAAALANARRVLEELRKKKA